MRNDAIIPSNIEHARSIAARIRVEDELELQALGMGPADGVVDSFEQSLRSWTLVCGGEPIAIWGVCADSVLDEIGTPWLLTACEVAGNRVRFARLSRGAVERMLEIFPKLENWVDARYIVCVRYLRWLGFTIHPAVPYGPYGLPFHRFEIARGMNG